MGHRRQFRLAVCAVGVVAAACNGVLGIHELAGNTATTDGGAADGATDSTVAVPPDSSTQETGADVSFDAGMVSIMCDLDATASDPANCGNCGHNCLGGACEAGACQPFQVSSPVGTPNYLTLGPATVYWTETNTNSVASAPKIGGGAITLVVGQANQPAGVVVDSQRLYWGSNAYNICLSSCPLGTCGAPTLPTAMCGPSYNGIYNVAIFDGSVYGPAIGTGQIIQCPVSAPDDASCSFVIENRPGPNGIAVDNSGIYWTEDGSGGSGAAVYMCPLTGCVPAPVSIAQNRANPSWIALDANNIYWIEIPPGGNQGSIYECKKSNCTAPTTLATGLANPHGLAVDSTFVYWVDDAALGSNGSLQRCTIGDCETPTTLATSDSPFDVAIDDAAVYWTSTGSLTHGVWKIAK